MIIRWIDACLFYPIAALTELLGRPAISKHAQLHNMLIFDSSNFSPPEYGSRIAETKKANNLFFFFCCTFLFIMSRSEAYMC